MIYRRPQPPTRTDRELFEEAFERTRRIETRLTKFMEFMGFDTGAQKPTWREGAVSIPSLSSSLKEILEVVPKDWPADTAVEVLHKQELVCDIFIPEKP